MAWVDCKVGIKKVVRKRVAIDSTKCDQIVRLTQLEYPISKQTKIMCLQACAIFIIINGHSKELE